MTTDEAIAKLRAVIDSVNVNHQTWQELDAALRLLADKATTTTPPRAAAAKPTAPPTDAPPAYGP